MRLFQKAKDGGPNSPVDAYFLFEIKTLMSIVFKIKEIEMDIDPNILILNERIDELEHEVAILRKSLTFYERERNRFRHTKPEFTGDFFISGKLGVVDGNGLPDKLEICPSYGCAWTQVYEKTDKTISYEGS